MGSTGRANGSVAAKATASAARTGAADGNPPACPASVALPPPGTPPQRADRVSVPFARCPAAPTWHGEPGFAFRNGTPGTPAFFFSHPDECGVSAVTHFQTVTRPERSLSFEFRTRGSLEAATSIRARRRTSPGTARHSRCQVTAGRSSPVFFWDTQRGALFTLDGIESLPPCRVTRNDRFWRVREVIQSLEDPVNRLLELRLSGVLRHPRRRQAYHAISHGGNIGKKGGVDNPLGKVDNRINKPSALLLEYTFCPFIGVRPVAKRTAKTEQKKQRRAAPMRSCAGCGRQIHTRVRVCPRCGAEQPRREPGKEKPTQRGKGDWRQALEARRQELQEQLEAIDRLLSP